MTPFEMFGKLVDKFGIASVRHEPAVANKIAGYAVYNDMGQFGPVCETKEEAIKAAYAKMCPPILSSVGIGDEEWRWHKGSKWWESRFHVGAQTKLLAGEKRVYIFSESSHDSARLVPAEMRGFLKLIEITPELRPPAEENGKP